MSTFRVVLHRVNPVNRMCDDTGRQSCFYDSVNGFNILKEKAKKSFFLNKNCDFFDFDNDVYFVTITNIKTNKIHYIV